MSNFIQTQNDKVQQLKDEREAAISTHEEARLKRVHSLRNQRMNSILKATGLPEERKHQQRLAEREAERQRQRDEWEKEKLEREAEQEARRELKRARFSTLLDEMSEEDLLNAQSLIIQHLIDMKVEAYYES